MPSRNEELLLLVGKLNYSWTNTESLLIYVMEYLMAVPKEVAIVVFLTLNTTRARLDLIERLVKLPATPAADREFVVTLTARMKAVLVMRNKYNHCVYGFDDNGTIESTQLMRIADFGTDLKYGRVDIVDENELARIDRSIASIITVNHDIIAYLEDKGTSLGA